MRLISYWVEGRLKPGLQVGEQLFAASDLSQAAGLGPRHWPTTRALLEAGESVREALAATAAEQADRGDVDPVGVISQIRLGPPVPDAGKIVCLGLNYRDHAEEADLPIPETPLLFAKFANSLIGPADEIQLPKISQAVDYEAELAVVIGRPTKSVSAARATDAIAGVMAFNDISARDLQAQTSQWTAGKALDTFAPCGPALVGLDEVGDLQNLAIRARVNGRLVQESNTSAMIFGVAEAIAFVSSVMTLVPGDIIATGTPAGVGFLREPPLLLSSDDVVEVELENVGALRNPVVEGAEVPIAAPLTALSE